MSYQEIEAAVAELSEVERLRLLAFLRRQSEPDDAWDEKMAHDFHHGRLDELLAEADREIDAGRTAEL